MKKKTIISSILAILLLMSTIPLSDMVSAIKSEIWQQPIGTIIEFGSYPQSQVTDNTLISSLNAISKSWISYKYFSGECSYFGMDDWAESGNMAPKDYMKYADFSYSGNKYRAVRFTSYRPSWTGGTSLSSGSAQEDNGYYINNIYYFKFEPLKWRILDPSEGYVMCENLIDNQPFNNYLYYKKDYYSDSNYSIYASDYANSSIRNWLNDNFYNTAFSSSEQEKISISECENNSPYNSKYNSVSTNDKVFLLSFNDLLNDSYGFSSSNSNDSYREAEGTDYAKCQGLLVNTKNSAWSLRSPSTSLGLYVNENGSLYSYWGTSCNYGIRPAIKFNSNSTSFSGKCGENVFYNLNESTGLLTINGSGDMYNYYDIGENSPFYNNSFIKTVIVENGVTSIGDYTFAYCFSLQSVTIGNSVASIGDYAFNNCCNLTDILYAGTEKEWSEISIGEGNECLTEAAIYYEAYCAINGHTASEIWNTVVLPTYTEEGLEVQACEKCGLIINSRAVAKLEPKVFGNFKYCIVDDEVNIIECDENAVSVEIPKTIEGYPVTYVYYDAFYNCDQLKNVTIEADISISYFNDLFEKCVNLENVIIGSSVSSISIGAFYNCSNLLSITVDKNNEYYSSDSNGILYFKDKTYIIRYPTGKESTTFEIPSGVKTIGFGSFSGCSNLQTVIIPEGVSLIGDRAFENCDNLKTVYIPKSLTELAGYGAFHYSDSITDVYYASSKQDWDNLGGTEYFGLDQNKVTIHYGSNSQTDTEKPVVKISSTNNVASSQAVTAVISDNKELKGYYFGSNSDYTKNTYSKLSGKTMTIQKTISNPARYYFTAVDKTGNVSVTKSIRLYKTELNANGGTVTPSYVLTPEGKTFTFPTPTRNGYSCEGWSTDNTATAGENSLAPKSNGTYYAIWKLTNTSKPSLILKTTLDVATTQTATIIVESSNELAGYYFGTNSDYSKNTFTKLSGKKSTIKKTISSSGKYYIAVADEFGNLSDVKAYRYYKTTLDANGGSVTPSYVLTASSKSFTFPTPTRSGYTCIGWAKSNTATTGEQSLTPTSNSTYYAIWKSNNPSVRSVKIYDKDIKYKDTINASPVIEKEDGAEYTIKYKSSDTSVAYIEGNGNINAVGRGDTTITVTVTDKNGNTFSDKCNVHVHYSFGQWLIKIFLFGWIWY